MARKAPKDEEPELKPSYTRRLNRIRKQKAIKIGSVENLRKRYGLEP